MRYYCMLCLKERTIQMHFIIVKISGMCFCARCKLNSDQIMRCRYSLYKGTLLQTSYL